MDKLIKRLTDENRELRSENKWLRDAAKPIAKYGNVFLPVDNSDKSCWLSVDDKQEIPLGTLNGWFVTVGQLRALARAYDFSNRKVDKRKADTLRCRPEKSRGSKGENT